jgi:hypothetical protein
MCSLLLEGIKISEFPYLGKWFNCLTNNWNKYLTVLLDLKEIMLSRYLSRGTTSGLFMSICSPLHNTHTHTHTHTLTKEKKNKKKKGSQSHYYIYTPSVPLK